MPDKWREQMFLEAQCHEVMTTLSFSIIILAISK